MEAWPAMRTQAIGRKSEICMELVGQTGVKIQIAANTTLIILIF